jgi:hypothetical protein
MKRFLIAAAVVAAMASIATPADATDVGISITVGQPDFYGRIDIGDYPRPQLLYRQPILVERVSYREPIYMRVPPGHAKHWSKHCREYDACGERVYFVQDSWYSNEYVPRYREQHRDHHGDHGDGQRSDNGYNNHSDNHGNNHGDNHGGDRGGNHNGK